MKYKSVIFDLDGTLLDTLDDLKDSLNFALKKEGFKTRTLEEVRAFVGNGIRNLIKRGAGENASEEEIDKIHSSFTSYYKTHCADKTKPYNGIIPLLEKLKENNIKTAVVSNKADYAVSLLCREYFKELLDISVGEKENVRKKPCPDSVNEVLKTLSLSREDSVYVGDSEVDIETAKNAGMDCIIVSWGFRSKDFLKSRGAEKIVASPEEIFDEINKKGVAYVIHNAGQPSREEDYLGKAKITGHYRFNAEKIPDGVSFPME